MDERIEIGPLNSFIHGLMSPSMTAVSAAALTLCVLVVGFFQVVTPSVVAAHGTRVLGVFDNDYDLLVTTRALELQTLSDRQSPLLVLLGPSGTRASLSEADLLAGLNELGLKNVEIANLSSFGQSLWHAWTLVGSLPADTKGVVVLGVVPNTFSGNPSDLSAPEDKYRLGIRDETADDYLRSLGIDLPARGLDNYAWQNLEFLMARRTALVSNLVTGRPPTYVENSYRNKRRPQGGRLIEREPRIANKLRDLELYYESNLKVVDAIRREIESREGLSLVVFEAPLNPEFVKRQELENLLARHYSNLRAYALSHGIDYIEGSQILHLNQDDFYDWGHLNSVEATASISTGLISRVAKRLQGGEKVSGG